MIDTSHFDKFPELESKRLILKKLTLEDAFEIQKVRSNEAVMKYMDSNDHKTIEQSIKFIAEVVKKYGEKTGIAWGIIEKDSKQFIGDFAFTKIDHKNSRAEIGYTLKPEFWGKGFMKEAMRECINFGFTDLKLHSFEANINPENNNSRKILTEIGFRKEAFFRENYYYNGKFLDSEIYSLLEVDFQR